MEEILLELNEKLIQKQKAVKSAANKIKAIKTAFSKGDLKKVNEEIENVELEKILTTFQLKTEFEKLKQILSSYRSKLRLEFDAKFIEESHKLGIKKITGNSMDYFKVNGHIKVKINFSNNVCAISTFAKNKSIRSISPNIIAKEVKQEVKRLFERKFDPDKFLMQLYEAYKICRIDSISQVLLKDIHKVVWLKKQDISFFEKSETKKMVSYPIDEFSVDLSKLIDFKVDRLNNGYQLKLALGRDGINIYQGTEKFNSYKFLEFAKEAESHG